MPPSPPSVKTVPVVAVTPTPPTCPDDAVLVPKLRPLYAASYGGSLEDLEIHIVSCQWGSWAGPSFVVHHSIPELPNQEVASLGGIAIVRADGTLVASHFGEGAQHVSVEGFDLDGDGNDEIFETGFFDGRAMAPVSGSTLAISRVVGKDIVALDVVTTKLETSMIEPAESCETTMQLVAVGTAKHVVFTAKVSGDRLTSQCLSAGRHEFALEGGKLRDLAQPR